MSNPIEYSRLIMKRTQVSGATPSINTGDTIDNTWTDSDILTGELFYNIPDQKLYTRSGEDIVLLSQGTTGSTTTQTLSETLIAGNTTGNNWIEVDETSTGKGLFSGVYNSDFNLINFKSDRLLFYSWDGVSPKSQVTLWRNGVVDIQGDEQIGISAGNSGLIVQSSDVISFESISDFIIKSPTITFSGAQYDIDYSANFTNRSLVDKEYVDGSTLPLSGSLDVNVSPTASTTNFAGYYAIGKSIANNKELDFLHYIPKRSSLSVPLGILPGSFVLATVPLNDSSSDFFEFRYNARKTTSPYGREVGTITAFYDVLTTTVVFSRTGPVAIGDVSGLDFNVILTGATLQLTVELTGSSDWEFYTHTTTYASGFVE